MPQTPIAPRKPAESVWPILIRHFFGRFFDRESLSPQGEPEANVIQTLGILATPGAFFVLLFVTVSVTGWDLVAVRCLFITFSTLVMGFIVVFEWDALFLDRRDYQILSPLPLPPWQLFVAKAMALGLFLSLFLGALNCFSSLFWPIIDTAEGAPGLIGTHLAIMVAAGLFAALAAGSVQGVLLTVLPQRMLRPVSAVMQTVLMTVMVMLFFLSPLACGALGGLIRSRSPLVYYFPPWWFGGLYERMRPAVRSRDLLDLGGLAVPALGCAAALFVLTHLPGYRGHARRMIDSPPSNPSGPGHWRMSLTTTIDRLLLKDPVQQAVFHFIGQTLARGMKHRLFLATYAGFGAALAITSFGEDRNALLRLPLTLSFVLVSGLRAAFSFPAELQANWTFRVCAATSARECMTATRKWIAVCGLLPLFLCMTPVEFRFFRLPVAVFHLLYGASLSALLVETMFHDFRKIPFTCGYFPGKINLVWLSVIYVFGFTTYSSTMAGFESRLTGKPVAATIFIPLALLVWLLLACRRRRLAASESELDYDGAGDPEVRTLELTAQ